MIKVGILKGWIKQNSGKDRSNNRLKFRRILISQIIFFSTKK